MKRILQVCFGVLALAVVSPLGAVAAPVQAPLAAPDLAAIFSPAAADSGLNDVSWAAEVGVSDDDASDVVVRICCRGALAVCTTSCGGSVSSFSCTAAGSGCSSNCTCG